VRRFFSLLSIATFLPLAIAHATTPPLPKANPSAGGGSAPVQEGTIFSKTIGASRSFNMSTTGTWDGKVLTVVESYQYAAGDSEQRIWKFTKTGDGKYSATSKEIQKKIEIEIKGRVASFKYQKKLPRPGKKPVKVTFTEKWSLKKNGILESTTKLSKLVRVGQEAINFARVGNEAALKAPGF